MPVTNQIDYSISLRSKDFEKYKYLSYVLSSSGRRYYIKEPRIQYLKYTKTPFSDGGETLDISDEFFLNSIRPWDLEKISTLMDSYASYGIEPAGSELDTKSPDEVPLFGIIFPFDKSVEQFDDSVGTYKKIVRENQNGILMKFFIPPGISTVNVVTEPLGMGQDLNIHDNLMQIIFGKDGSEAISTSKINLITGGFFKCITIVLTGMASYKKGHLVAAHLSNPSALSHSGTLSTSFNTATNGNVLSSMYQDVAYNSRKMQVINGSLVTDTFSKFFLGNPTKGAANPHSNNGGS